ncbi:MAG: SCP-2 sterol transfer family protein, partial [Halothiobacillaceae bacterium]
MAALFSDSWASLYRDAWNNDPELSGALAKIGFNSTIGYGFQSDDAAKCFIKVENGFVTDAGAYTSQPLSWDLRASPADWDKWLSKGLGMMSL